MRPSALRRLLATVALTFPLSCAAARAAAPEGNTGLPQVRLMVGGKALTAEVASTPQQQRIGLMYRRSLPPDHGMLFVWERPQAVCMWMKNTWIALSVAFLDADGRIVNIADMQPLTEDVHCAQTAVRYALEMPLHWFARHGIAPGARVSGLPPPTR
jgi:uncharacterized membrane protein (UPF0127 family)